MRIERVAVAGAAVLMTALLAGCGGGTPQGVVPLPPAGTWRIAAVETPSYPGVVDEITRHAYDARGWLVGSAVYRVVDGVPSAQPVASITREHDEHGRLLRVTTQRGDVRTVLEAAYGLDGRLESTSTTGPDGRPAVTNFTWQGGRLSGYTGPAETTRVVYDAEGRPATFWHKSPLSANEDKSVFRWRDDGQLGNALIRVDGRPVSLVRNFNTSGQLFELKSYDDGFWDRWHRFEYDARGRVEYVIVGVVPDIGTTDPEVFSGSTRYRVVWEDALCQPVYEPAPPPSIDIALTGAASPLGATLVCSDRR